jgi:hypothetical protein
VKFGHSARLGQLAFAGILVLASFSVTPAWAQASANERPVPVLTGSAGFFTSVIAGQTALEPQINPVLLVPFGDRFLIESRAEFLGDFERSGAGHPFTGKVEKELDYLQLDFIASRYVTVTAGRFLTPFGIYNERLYPIWIRSLQAPPLVFPLGAGSSDGVMLRGGFSLNPKVNLNYAGYFSTLSTVNRFESDRSVGARAGVFLPGPRIELGSSWEKLLQEDRSNTFGFHFAWQPTPLPLNLRSEYARSNKGSGYWVEGAYRLSQVDLWRSAMRRTECVVRMQQFFVGRVDADELEEYGLPLVNARQVDIGLNYYLRDGLKATAGYGRDYNHQENFNAWTFGIAWRFAIPLGREGAL